MNFVFSASTPALRQNQSGIVTIRSKISV